MKGKSYYPLNFLDVTSPGSCYSQGRCNNNGCLTVLQIMGIYALKDRVILSALAPASCVKVAPGTSAQLPSRGWSWGMDSCYYAKTEIDQIL